MLAQLELSPVPDFKAARRGWTELAERSGNLFGTLEWLTLWWRHFGCGRLELWRLGESPAPTALFAMHLHDGRLRFLGAPHGDELGPVVTGAMRDEAARALGRLLHEGDLPWQRFEAHDVPADVGWTEATGARVTDRTASPVLALDAGWPGFLESRSRNFRGQLRSRERRLARAFRVSVRLADDPERLECDLDALFALHAARWGPRRARGFAGPARAFHRAFAAVALERGWLRLRFLELDGVPAAALLNFGFGGSEWYYQGGRDPAYDRYAPGLVLQLRAIRSAFEDGLKTYRFLRGDEAYKRRLASHDRGLVSLHLDRPTR